MLHACRIVAESLKEVEEEQEAIEAELVRMSSSQGRDRESSPNPCDVHMHYTAIYVTSFDRACVYNYICITCVWTGLVSGVCSVDRHLR